ncbi:MAG: ABC transporter permease [Muribaculaceae bacterium]|nr:ABC transporter permease [Muribaculaceae bacterium]
MNYIRQIIFEMRHHPLMTWLSIIGTAIAIFLIMSDYMIANIDNVSVSPESRRSRIVYGYGVDIYYPEINGSSCLSNQFAHEMYDNLDGAELISYSSYDAFEQNMTTKGGIPEIRKVKAVDENYWEIYDYNFEEGKPMTKEEVESGIRNVILTRSTAENFFSKQESYLGREIMIDGKSWTVSGIISDINPLLDISHSDAFISHVAAGKLNEMTWSPYMGTYLPIILMKEGVDISHLKNQIKNRYDAFNAKHKSEDIRLVYHEQPWSIRERHATAGTNKSPESGGKDKMRLIGYAILLLVPAINLSSMTRSRMRQRVSEIGLRRAFGCTRGRIVADLLTENFILTLIGGAIGLTLSIIFITCFSNYFISYVGMWLNSIELTKARPSFMMLFSWRAFAAIVVFCLLLNIFSAGIPALKAAFTNPAEAINGLNNHK